MPDPVALACPPCGRTNRIAVASLAQGPFRGVCRAPPAATGAAIPSAAAAAELRRRSGAGPRGATAA